ncbi:MAG TPA: right-handed parallel beta-helix repeat-containing protein, partial [Verrucomicrobiae bacterium]|nr:right-handed parallel beta-helix repeat-containing protein [Verrucomicrobiae bacterium]
TSVGSGRYRLRQMNGQIGNATVGDWLVCRAPGGTSIIQLDNSQGCTLRRVTLKNAGFAAFFETGGNGGHHYVDCRVTHGPKPDGATEQQLVSCGADGFHSTGTRVGPTIERCIWDGVLLDDCIAIHGSFQTVVRAAGNKLVLEGRNRAGFAVNEPVRISSRDGFFAQAKCVALRTLDTPERDLELTLDRSLPVPNEAKAGNPDRCGKSYKIIGCTLGNTRSRGILVKADDGLIRGCDIVGCGMSAVSIGPEYYWNEANYSWNVTVADNHFRHNSLRNNLNADGVIFLHGDGAIGNRNIDITNNIFDENYCPYMINLGWADGVNITGNIINAPSPLPLSDSGYVINLHDVRHVTLRANIYNRPGPSIVRAVELGKDVEGVTGNDDFGIRLGEK